MKKILALLLSAVVAVSGFITSVSAAEYGADAVEFKANKAFAKVEIKTGTMHKFTVSGSGTIEIGASDIRGKDSNWGSLSKMTFTNSKGKEIGEYNYDKLTKGVEFNIEAGTYYFTWNTYNKTTHTMNLYTVLGKGLKANASSSAVSLGTTYGKNAVVIEPDKTVSDFVVNSKTLNSLSVTGKGTIELGVSNITGKDSNWGSLSHMILSDENGRQIGDYTYDKLKKGVSVDMSEGIYYLSWETNNDKEHTMNFYTDLSGGLKVAGSETASSTGTSSSGKVSLSVQLTIGDKLTLSPGTDLDITWKSSKSSIAKVSSKGVIEAVTKGTATITATDSNGSTSKINITVK